MNGINLILIGAAVLLAGGAIGVLAVLSPKARPAFVYAQLVLIVGIYVGFAISNLDAAGDIQGSGWSILIIESFTALAFLMGGLAVVHSSRAWLLGVMLLAHGGVDLVHLLIGADYSPDWYEFLCIVYDAIVGVAAIWLLSEPSAKNTAAASSL
jgi:hypothetical protein